MPRAKGFRAVTAGHGIPGGKIERLAPKVSFLGVDHGGSPEKVGEKLDISHSKSVAHIMFLGHPMCWKMPYGFWLQPVYYSYPSRVESQVHHTWSMGGSVTLDNEGFTISRKANCRVAESHQHWIMPPICSNMIVMLCHGYSRNSNDAQGCLKLFPIYQVKTLIPRPIDATTRSPWEFLGGLHSSTRPAHLMRFSLGVMPADNWPAALPYLGGDPPSWHKVMVRSNDLCFIKNSWISVAEQP